MLSPDKPHEFSEPSPATACRTVMIGVPSGLHSALNERAVKVGISAEAYIIRLLCHMVNVPAYYVIGGDRVIDNA